MQVRRPPTEPVCGAVAQACLTWFGVASPALQAELRDGYYRAAADKRLDAPGGQRRGAADDVLLFGAPGLTVDETSATCLAIEEELTGAFNKLSNGGRRKGNAGAETDAEQVVRAVLPPTLLGHQEELAISSDQTVHFWTAGRVGS